MICSALSPRARCICGTRPVPTPISSSRFASAILGAFSIQHPQPVLLGELLQDGAKNDLLRAGIWAILAGLKHNDRIVRIFGSKDLTRDVAYKIHALARFFQSLHRQVLENRGIGEETAWEVYD